jgi:RHS repeat-associated protein
MKLISLRGLSLIVLTLCFVITIAFFAPVKSHAQSGISGDWFPGFLGGGCSGTPGNVICPSAAAACQSLADFYAEGSTPRYAYIIQTGIGFQSNIGTYESGLSCAWPYLSDNFVGGLSEILPPGTVGDSNSPSGVSPAGVGTVQVLGQIGDGSLDSGDDNTHNSAPGGGLDDSQTIGNTGNPIAGEPINIATGNMAYPTTDYITAGQNPLTFTRYFNSRGTFVGTLGVNWRSSYDRYIWLYSSTQVGVQRAAGQMLTFTLNNGTWTTDTDVDYALTQAGTAWTLTDPNDTVETYTKTSIGYAPAFVAQLNTIRSRNGYTKTLTYNSNGVLSSVTDSYGRSLLFAYNSNGTLNTVTTPDNTVLTYGYTSVSGGYNLTSVTFPTMPAQTRTYVYANSNLPNTLTGVIDENGNTLLTWTYDPYGRALTSQLGTGSNANITTLAYNDTNGSRTVTNPLGETNTYTFATLQGKQKVTQISRVATSTTAAATRTFTYDASGYMASATDWNGNLATYVNNSHGEPTTRNEAVGSPVARSTLVTYDPVFVHLPDSIVTPGLTASFVYDGNGNALTRTLTDTTTTTAPYSTNGQTRAWNYTYDSTGHALTAQSPNGHSTSFAYSSDGTLISITDALSHAISVTSHTGGGRPLTIVDPNVVTTTLGYDARQRLLTSSTATAQGARTITYTYDAAGNLIKTTLPDGSALTDTYDTAHRLTTITDLFHQNIAYTLDAAGDRTKTNLTAVGNRIQRQHSDVFDALGRAIQDIGGVGQTTGYGYDANGNALTVTDPLGRVATRKFDALNRLSQATDPNAGITSVTYDAHNRVLSVTDPNSNTTTYVYDGFGDLIQQTSPDSGITLYRYDADGNLIQKTDAAAKVTNNTFDAVNRILATSYPADSTLNVTYTYDQTGHGFGVGRLTFLTDAAGTLSRLYDERGKMLNETRVNGSTTLTTAYTYDAASRVSSIRYPSGWTVTQTRDIMGRIYQLPVSSSTGSPAGNAIINATYEPFGPLYTLSYGNGVNESRHFDLDYRVTNLTDAGTAFLQNFNYSYDADNNVSSIGDGVTPANGQTFGYDVLNRLNAASGSYGVLEYTYDKVGNRLTQTLMGAITNYAYTAGTNQLANITTGGSTTPVSYTAAGNISSVPPTTGAPAAILNYSAANRFASVSGTTPAITDILYDAFGRRFSKVNPGSYPILYTYDQSGNLLEETNGHGLLVDYVYLDSRPVAEITGGLLYYFHADRLGTPQVVTDGGQNVVWNTRYQPFGQTGIPIGSITQNLRFPGQYADGETGFSYNGFRDYMPALGRYSESDVIGLRGDINTYRYAGGDPQRNVDRFGLCVEDLCIGEIIVGRILIAESASAGPVLDALFTRLVAATYSAITTTETGAAATAATYVTVNDFVHQDVIPEIDTLITDAQLANAYGVQLLGEIYNLFHGDEFQEMLDSLRQNSSINISKAPPACAQ